MSLLDFFFNSNYRDSVLNPVYSTNKSSETSEKEKRKFWRDYHYKTIKHEVDLLKTDIMYGFIKHKSITLDVFIKFIKRRNGEEWVIPGLWRHFNTKP